MGDNFHITDPDETERGVGNRDPVKSLPHGDSYPEYAKHPRLINKVSKALHTQRESKRRVVFFEEVLLIA